MQNKTEKTSERFKMIERWKASGKSIKAFCKEENLSYFMFLYWRDKYLRQNKPAVFIKIKPVKRVPANDYTCEIILANGNRINFPVSPEAAYLKELLT